MIAVAFSIDSLFDVQDGPSNSLEYFEVDSVCRVFFMFIGIRFYGARTGLPDTDKTCICPDEARFAHFSNLFDGLPTGLNCSLQTPKPPALFLEPRRSLPRNTSRPGPLDRRRSRSALCRDRMSARPRAGERDQILRLVLVAA